MAVTITKWNPSEDIKTREDIAAYLSAALEENDAELLLMVIGDIARSEGMAQLAAENNLNRESLYKSFSATGNPSFITVMKVLRSLGISLYAKTA